MLRLAKTLFAGNLIFWKALQNKGYMPIMNSNEELFSNAEFGLYLSEIRLKLVKVYSNICYQVALSNALFYNTSLFDYAVVVQCGI